MNQLSLKRRSLAHQRSAKPALSPYQWLNALTLSPQELMAAREHVERSLNIDEVGGR